MQQRAYVCLGGVQEDTPSYKQSQKVVLSDGIQGIEAPFAHNYYHNGGQASSNTRGRKTENYEYAYRDNLLNGDRDGSMLETAIGGIFCFFLFLLVIFCIAYPLTMYKDTPPNALYSDDKWWCYHCLESSCARRCWYSSTNGF